MRNTVKEKVAKVKNQICTIMNGKDKGIAGIVVTVLLCVIAVSLTALFRTEAGNMIDKIFDTMTQNINNILFTEFTPGT